MTEPTATRRNPIDTRTEVLLSILATRILKRRLEVLKTENVLREAEGGYEVAGYWVERVFHLEVAKLPSMIKGEDRCQTT